MKKKNIAGMAMMMALATTGVLPVEAAQQNGNSLLRRPETQTEAKAQPLDFRKGFSSVAAAATPAVVFIQVEKEVPMGQTFFFNNPFDLFGEEFSLPFGNGNGRFNRRMPSRKRAPVFRQTGQGSGFLISKDGYILTNTHVVGDVDRITVKLSDGREFKAKRIGADPKTEVALIKIESEKDLPYLKPGNPDALMTGEWVIAIGNPFGLKETLTVGVVSAKGRSGMGITDYEDFIQTDAAINPGNSGGPLLNIDGEVIGINTAIYSRSGGYMGIGFAIPIDMAMGIKDQLVTSGKVTRGYIGVMLNPGELTTGLAKNFGFDGNEGALIAEVLKDSPAEKGGMQAGDIVTALNGKKITDGAHFRKEVARIMPKEKVTVTVSREGKTKDLTIEVAAYPDDDAVGSVESDAEGSLDKLGLTLQDLTPEVAERLDLGDLKRGVLISEVEPGSAADKAGLESGMVILEVNRTKVETVKEFKKSAGKAKEGNLLLRVKTPQGSFFKSLSFKD